MKLNQKGITLIELLIVVIVLGVIASISIPAVGSIVENTQVRADEATVLGMNQATYYYVITNPNQVQSFANMESNEERIQTLLQTGFLSQEPSAQHSETIYVFDEEHLLWCRNSCSAISGVIDFSSPNFSLADFSSKSGTTDHFSVEGNSLIATPPVQSDDILFFSNPRSTYTITVNFAIQPRTTGSNRGGLGILFETTLNNNNPDDDTGFILQVDRHFSQILIRRRNGGSETNDYPIRYDVVFNNGSVSYEKNETNNLHPNRDTYRDHSWWEENHQLILSVSEVGNTKALTVSIDGSFVFEWTMPSNRIVSPEDASLNYTGIRAWWSVPVNVNGFSISD